MEPGHELPQYADPATAVETRVAEPISASLVRYVPLGVALILACAMYAPAVPRGLYGDDYAYLLAAREMSRGDYLAAALDPTSQGTPLHFPGGYWRPLSSLSWQATAPLFGSNGTPYHLLNLAIHLAAVTMTWLLARRIAGGTIGPAAAALVFALHPASIEAVAWASSVNSAALPFALAAWLALSRAVEGGAGTPGRARWLLSASGLLATALLFRETVMVIAAAAALWYVVAHPPPMRTVTPRDALQWTAPVLAMAVPVAAYFVASSAFFTQSSTGNRLVVSWDGVENWGFYVRYVGVPIGPPTAAYAKAAGAGVGVGLLLLLPAALLTRRFVLAALLLAFFVSLAPYSFILFGGSVRYLYFPLAPLTLAGAVLLAEFERPATRLWPNVVPAGAAFLFLVAIPVAIYGSVRADRYATATGDKQDAWLEQVTAQWPTWPHEGGRLFSANTPSSLSIFGGFTLKPALEYVYDGPAPAEVVVVDERDLPRVEFITTEHDAVFVFEP